MSKREYIRGREMKYSIVRNTEGERNRDKEKERETTKEEIKKPSELKMF